jgi:two-component system CheB/CheR fusion protein
MWRLHCFQQSPVDNHHASIMRKTGSKPLPALARLALAATGTGAGEPIARADPSGTAAR